MDKKIPQLLSSKDRKIIGKACQKKKYSGATSASQPYRVINRGENTWKTFAFHPYRGINRGETPGILNAPL